MAEQLPKRRKKNDSSFVGINFRDCQGPKLTFAGIMGPFRKIFCIFTDNACHLNMPYMPVKCWADLLILGSDWLQRYYTFLSGCCDILFQRANSFEMPQHFYVEFFETTWPQNRWSLGHPKTMALCDMCHMVILWTVENKSTENFLLLKRK